MTSDQTWLSKSSMLTTSPACSARHSSSRIVRTSTRAVSPSREIWPDIGLTHQAPMRSIAFRPFSRLATLPEPRHRRCSVISEVFRVFQTELRTSRASPAYRGIVANKSEVKERISDDWRFCTWPIGEKERSIGDRSGWPDCRDLGPYTSVHPVWLAHSARDCRGPAGATGFPWRHSHLHSGCPPAFLYRFLSNGCLLHGKPQAGFYEGAPAGVRLVLWRRG